MPAFWYSFIFSFRFGCKEGSAETELQDIDQLTGGTDQVFGLPHGQTFVHDHGDSVLTRLGGAWECGTTNSS
jgi:hypothetical protein